MVGGRSNGSRRNACSAKASGTLALDRSAVLPATEQGIVMYSTFQTFHAAALCGSLSALCLRCCPALCAALSELALNRGVSVDVYCTAYILFITFLPFSSFRFVSRRQIACKVCQATGVVRTGLLKSATCKSCVGRCYVSKPQHPCKLCEGQG